MESRPVLAAYAARLSSPWAIRNSEKIVGSICMWLAIPTGKDWLTYKDIQVLYKDIRSYKKW